MTGYVVERRDDGKKSWMYVGRIDPENTVFSSTGLNEGMDYFFRVYAENRHGRSGPLESSIAVVPKRIFGECNFLFTNPHDFFFLICF